MDLLTCLLAEYQVTRTRAEINDGQGAIKQRKRAKEDADDLLPEKKELEAHLIDEIKISEAKEAILYQNARLIGNYVHDSVPPKESYVPRKEALDATDCDLWTKDKGDVISSDLDDNEDDDINDESNSFFADIDGDGLNDTTLELDGDSTKERDDLIRDHGVYVQPRQKMACVNPAHTISQPMKEQHDYLPEEILANPDDCIFRRDA
ncbi:MAG: hypothetical protein Q9227_005471 [Pyrenula ochraceoflavens]